MVWETVPKGDLVEGCDGAVYQRHDIIPDDHYWSLNPYKRPPLEVWKKIQEGRRLETDTSPDRLPIWESFKHLKTVGKDIRELKHKHVGPVAILGNGRSLQDHDLHKIPCPIVGMNRTYRGWAGYDGPDPDYYCFIDLGWIHKGAYKNSPFPINMTQDPEEIGWRVAKSYRMKPFSFDIWRDGVCPVNTGYAALQVAAYLGFEELYLLGFDYTKPAKKFIPGEFEHFDNSPSGQGIQVQPEWLEKAAPVMEAAGLKTFWVGCDDPSDVFPSISYEEFLERAS